MRVWMAVIMMGLAGLAQAAIKTEQVDYKSADGTKLWATTPTTTR